MTYVALWIRSRIAEAEALQGSVDVSDEEIKTVLDHLGGSEVQHADIQKKKRIVQTLFREILVFPQKRRSMGKIIIN